VRLAQLGGERAVQGRDAGLGGRVIGQVGGADGANDGGDGNDGAADLAARQGGEEGLEGVEVAEQVGREGLFDLGEGEGEEGFADDDGRVVD
jgi:hypothetical protein